MQTYYPLPIDFKRIMTRGKYPLVSITNSISSFIDFIILTGYEEYRRDDAFGCDIWENEFDILPSEARWQTDIKKSIETSIRLNETRLDSIKINIYTDETSILQKKIEIHIQAFIKLTGEEFQHRKIIYLCPRSVE